MSAEHTPIPVLRLHMTEDVRNHLICCDDSPITLDAGNGTPTMLTINECFDIDGFTEVEFAEFIVRACNSHQKLVDALKDLQNAVREHKLLDVKKRFSLCAADAQANTALALAKEKINT